MKPSPPAFIKIKPILVRLPALLSSPADSPSDGCSSSCCGWRRVNLLQNKIKENLALISFGAQIRHLSLLAGSLPTGVHSQEGKPPPKNMLKRSSGVMSASKPLWKSNPPPCEWPGLLGSSPPVRSYCRLLFGLLSTAYELPISGRTVKLLSHSLPQSWISKKKKNLKSESWNGTFKGFRCPRCLILVWMELERQFSVGFFELFIANVFVDSQHLVVVLTPFYSGGQEQMCDLIWLINRSAPLNFHKGDILFTWCQYTTETKASTKMTLSINKHDR